MHHIYSLIFQKKITTTSRQLRLKQNLLLAKFHRSCEEFEEFDRFSSLWRRRKAKYRRRSPWCLCARSGCRAGIWAPPGSAACRSRWWARCSSGVPTWTWAVPTGCLGTRVFTIERRHLFPHACFGFYFIFLATGFQSKPRQKRRSLTSRHLLHENLDEAVLADGAQVLDDVLVLEVFVQSDLLVKGLRVSGNSTKRFKS